MANSELLGKRITVPDNILDILRKYENDPKHQMRVSGIIERGDITYEQLKYFKHDLEQENDPSWSLILNWINRTLSTLRNDVERHKELADEAGLSNQYRSERELNLKSEIKSFLSESLRKKLK